MVDRPRIYGLMAEFESAEELLRATQRAYELGYRRMDAYSPYPVEGLWEALHVKFSPLPLLVLGAGITGAIVGFGMQYYATVIDYPLNVGGRPLNSWPAYVPVTFEVAVLFAAFTALLGMIILNGLPRPYHPVFNTPGFERSTVDRFFLSIEARDHKFNPTETRRFLENLGPERVSDIEL